MTKIENQNAMEELNIHLQIHYNQKGIQSVDFQPSNKGLDWSYFSNQADPKLENLVNQWLEDYGQRKNSSVRLSYDWAQLPLFTQQVLKAVENIPFGSLSTYGQIAHLLDRPQAARAVGGACGRNPFLLFIPCHRVLDAKLELRGYSAGGISVKRKLLVFEGLKK